MTDNNRFLSHIVTTENLNTALNDVEIIPNDYSLVTVKPFKTDGAGFVTDWLVVAERQFVPKWVTHTEDNVTMGWAGDAVWTPDEQK